MVLRCNDILFSNYVMLSSGNGVASYSLFSVSMALCYIVEVQCLVYKRNKMEKRKENVDKHR